MSLAVHKPFNHAAVIEGTLLSAYPHVWQGVYYFDPTRGRNAEEESRTVRSLIRHSHGNSIEGRRLQNFENDVTRAVKHGCGMTIPLSRIACYLMTEKNTGKGRLSHFFGDATLRDQDLNWIGRLFEEYVARHELFHSVEMLDPHFRPSLVPLQQSERGADAYSVLRMAREYGSSILPFAGLLKIGRDHQYARNHRESENSARNYLTQPAIDNAISFIREKGIKALRQMGEQDLFLTGRALGSPAACKPH